MRDAVLPGDVLGGRFQIIRLLGRGGMGMVFVASDLTLDREVAVKLLSSYETVTDKSRAAFEREARVLATLKHSNIVPLYDYGSSDGTPYLVMEMIDGQPLSKLLSTTDVDDADCVALTLQAARALSYSHKRGVLHRDIKPHNIMIENDGRLRLIDFGISHLMGTTGQFTEAGEVKGTPAYMAPECLQGAPPSVASDIYSLGRVLAQLFWTRPVPASFRPSTPAEVRELILWMTHEDAAHRPRDMGTVEARLAGIARSIGDPAGKTGGAVADILTQQVQPAPRPQITRPDVAMVCSSLGPNHLEVLVARPASLLHLWWDGGSWSEWVVMDRLPDGGSVTAIAAGSREAGQQDVFAVSSSGITYCRSYRGTWLPWEELPAPVGLRELATSSLRPGHLEVFALGSGGVEHSWWDGGSWSEWVAMDRLPDGGSVTAIAAGSREAGQQDVFAVSSSGSTFHRSFVFGGSSWGPWIDPHAELSQVAPRPPWPQVFTAVDKEFEQKWTKLAVRAFECLFRGGDPEEKTDILNRMRILVDEASARHSLSETEVFARSNYAWWLGDLGYAPQAVEHLSDIVAEITQLKGPYHIFTLSSVAALAHWLGVCGRLDEAIIQYRMVLERRFRACGPGSDDVHRTRLRLAELLVRSGEAVEAAVHASLALAYFAPTDDSHQEARAILKAAQSKDIPVAIRRQD